MGLKKEKRLPLQTESSASEETAIFTSNYRAVEQLISSKTAARPQRGGASIVPEGFGEDLTEPEGTWGPCLGR